MTLVAVEVGFRAYYVVRGRPLIVPEIINESMWRGRWIAQRQDRQGKPFTGSDEYHPTFGWKPQTNLDKARLEGLAPVSTNSRGWRNPRDFPFAKPPGVKRVVVVGDSFTYGEQEEDEHIWPVVLQDCLQGWEVINLAVHGYGTDQQCLVLREEGIRYQPDVVVVGFFVHNIYRNVLAFRDYAKPRFVLRNGRLELTNVPVPTPEEVLRTAGVGSPRSYALQWVRRRVRRATAGSAGYEITQEMWDVTRAIFREIKATCDTVDARLLVAIIPNPPRPAPEVEQRVVAWGQELGFETLVLRDRLHDVEQREGKPTFYLHFSRLGHVVTTQAVFERLRALHWVRGEEVGDLDTVRERYRLALEAKPLDADSKILYAADLAQRGKHDEAIRTYLEVLNEGSPEKVKIHTNLGTLYRLQGNMEQAEKHFRRAIELDASSAAAQMNLGNLLAEMERLGEAERVFRKALTLRPTPNILHARLGAVLRAQGKIDAAIEAYEAAVSAMPDHAGCRIELASLLTMTRRYARALEVLREAHKRFPDDDGVVNNLAWLLATYPNACADDGEEAFRLIERFGPTEAMGVEHVSLLDTRAASLATAGQYARAIETAERALRFAEQANRSKHAEHIARRLALYRSGKPYRLPQRVPATSGGSNRR